MQLVNLLSVSKFHALIWQFGKLPCVLETTARRAKISSISTPLKLIFAPTFELRPSQNTTA